jgi:hypothetical protein
MTDHEKNFRKWSVDALDPLRGKDDTGFIFAFVSLPLLERYLRQKSGAGEAISLPTHFRRPSQSLSGDRWKRE